MRRNGFSDSYLFAEHNDMIHDQEMFDSGTLFNLKSEFGVGTSLYPLIVELFKTIGLDPFANKNNIFFKEIIRLTLEVSKVKRSHSIENELNWMTNYAVSMATIKDEIAKEREERLYDLLRTWSGDSDNCYMNDNNGEMIMDMSSDEEPDIMPMDIDTGNNDLRFCDCLFCDEFRKYHQYTSEQRNIGMIINDTLMNISNNIHKNVI